VALKRLDQAGSLDGGDQRRKVLVARSDVHDVGGLSGAQTNDERRQNCGGEDGKQLLHGGYIL
jgi:hypothetical protein